MKKIPFLLIALFMVSCMSDQEKLIKAYEENIFDSQIDLSFKPIKTKKISNALAEDSIKFYESLLTDEGEQEIRECQRSISENQSKISLKEIEYKYEYDSQIRKLLMNSINAYKGVIAIDEDMIKDIESKKYSVVSQRLAELSAKRDLFLKKDSIVGVVWECTYRIVNPMLNNAKQTITKKYVFTPDNSNIIRALQ